MVYMLKPKNLSLSMPSSDNFLKSTLLYTRLNKNCNDKKKRFMAFMSQDLELTDLCKTAAMYV